MIVSRQSARVSRRRMALVSSIAILALLAIAGPASAVMTKSSIAGYSSYKSLVGITVIKHWSTTTFSYNGSYLKDPHGIPRNDAWTLPPTTETASSRWWNYYSYAYHGTGLSSARKKFVVGIPTPWGPVGSTITDTHLGHVYYDGFGYVD